MGEANFYYFTCLKTIAGVSMRVYTYFAVTC